MVLYCPYSGSRLRLACEDCLGLAEFQHAFLSALNADARLLEAAKGRVRAEVLALIDPDRAGLEACGNLLRPCNVARPDRGALAKAWPVAGFSTSNVSEPETAWPLMVIVMFGSVMRGPPEWRLVSACSGWSPECRASALLGVTEAESGRLRQSSPYGSLEWKDGFSAQPAAQHTLVGRSRAESRVSSRGTTTCTLVLLWTIMQVQAHVGYPKHS